jgi:hypothetical protein
VALDPRYATWNAWGNDEWPSEYLVDRGGRVRYFHRGEGGYAATEAAIRSLLAERRPPPPLRTDRLLLPPVGAPGSIVATPPSRLTPETYLGSRRRPDRVLGAVAPSRLPLHSVALGGRWRAEPERVVAAAGARLLLRFRAHRAYAVLAGRGTVRVTLDGRSRTALRVDGDRAYRLVQVAGPAATHLLELRLSPGLAAYTFTFD